MKTKKILSVLCSAVLCAGIVAGCGSSKVSKINDASSKNASKTTKSEKSKKIIIGETESFKGKFGAISGPKEDNSMSYYYYINNFYQALVNYDNGKIKPGLAEKWKVSDDGKVYTFYLKKGIKFSDGTDLTADVVKMNLENSKVILGKTAINYGQLNNLLDKISVVNDNEFQIHLKKPYFKTLIELSMVMPRGIMSSAAFNEDGTLSQKLKNASYGTGPYMYKGENDNNLSYKFVRNPYYKGKVPEVDEFTVKVIQDNASKALALQNGEVDILVGTENVSYESFKNLSKNKKFKGKVSDISSLTEFIALNSKKAPFDNIKVRQAIANCIDRKKIANVLFSGLKKPAGTAMDTRLPYCDISVTPYTYDIEKAKKLLEDAGWKDTDGDGIREKNGIKLSAEVKYVKNSMNDKMMFAVKSNLADIGMEIKLKGMELMTMFADVYNADNYQVCFYKTYGTLYDPFTFVTNMNPNTNYNKGVYSTDPMVSKALTSMNYDEAYKLTSTVLNLVEDKKITNAFHKILTNAHKDAVIIPVTYRNELSIYNSDIINDYKFNESNPSWIDISNIDLK